MGCHHWKLTFIRVLEDARSVASDLLLVRNGARARGASFLQNYPHLNSAIGRRLCYLLLEVRCTNSFASRDAS